MGDAIEAGTVAIPGANGDAIEAYLARPTEATAMGGVVVIHHMPGYDAGHKEITRRLATFGCAALCPNLYSREAPGADPDDAAAAARARGGVPDDRLVGDVEGGINYLRSLPASNGKAATIGFCSGGRQSVLAACRLPVDAAVDCYGAFVVGSPPPNFPIPIAPLYDLLPQLSGPLLGLFGNEDAHPSPADVDELDRRLTELGKVHEFHRYDGAGHAFFAVDRPSYRPAAASDGWLRVRDFLARHLAS
jgi:carboxymethylenebutenolidase